LLDGLARIVQFGDYREMFWSISHATPSREHDQKNAEGREKQFQRLRLMGLFSRSYAGARA
jgi:hypothetical protein